MSSHRAWNLVAELTYRCPLRCAYCSNPMSYAQNEKIKLGVIGTGGQGRVAHIGEGLRVNADAIEVVAVCDVFQRHLDMGYEAAGGQWRQESFHWWKVLCTLRWGLGLAGQAAAHLNGSVPSIVMAASGRRVAELEYDTLMLIRASYATS